MKKGIASRFVCQKAQMEILSSLLPLLAVPAMVQDETGRIILSNAAWNLDEEHDLSEMREIIINGSDGEPIFSVFVPLVSGGLNLSGNARWEESAGELKAGLMALIDGRRVSLPSPRDDDPLADVKRDYNAALETVERLISVSRLF